MEEPKLIEVEIVNNTWDCEYCGPVSDSVAHIKYPDGSEDELYNDDHFGGGGWTGTVEDLYKQILWELDYEVQVTYSGEGDD